MGLFKVQETFTSNDHKKERVRSEATFHSNGKTLQLVRDMLVALKHKDDLDTILDEFGCHVDHWNHWHQNGDRFSIQVADIGVYLWELTVLCDHSIYDRELLLHVADHYGKPYSVDNPNALNGVIIVDQLRRIAESIVVHDDCD